MALNNTEIMTFIREKLYVAAVCDILDGLGYRQQAMHHRLRPLLPDRKSSRRYGARWAAGARLSIQSCGRSATSRCTTCCGSRVWGRWPWRAPAST